MTVVRESGDFKYEYDDTSTIVDVRVAYIRKLAILGDRDHIVTANYSPVLYSYLWGHLTLIPDKPLCKYWSAYL